MKSYFLVSIMAIGLTTWGWAQASAGASTSTTAAASAPGASTGAQAAANLQAELTKGLDAKKAKVGDPVLAKTTQEFSGHGDLRIPKNTKLIGHVTEAQARGKGQNQSTLAIAFDKAQLKDGREIPLNAVIQTLAPPPSLTAADMGSTDMGAGASSGAPSDSTGGGRNGAVPAINSTVNSTTRTAGNVASGAGSVAGDVTGPRGGGALSTNPTGTVGLKGMQLDTAASSSEKGSVIRSNSENVRLESGTRLVLRIAVQ